MHDPHLRFVIGQIELARRQACVSLAAAGPSIDRLCELSALAAVEPAEPDPARLITDEVVAHLTRGWEWGWQPADLVHAVRRHHPVSVVATVARAIAVEADRAGAATRAPATWLRQLQALAARFPDPMGPWLPPGHTGSRQEWHDALLALHFLQRLPASQVIAPTPSQWGTAGSASFGGATPLVAESDDQHARTLARIRALLAKAESTDFAAEAEAFTAKAQHLMTRHAVDEALLAEGSAAGWQIVARRVLIHPPYAAQQVGVLSAVARANRVRPVWSDFASCATLVGTPTDVAQVEVLFTSLLVQGTAAMHEATSAVRGPERTAPFRRAFLTAYAVRLGTRLADASEEATEEAAAEVGSALVPVLAHQQEAVDHEFDRLFPQVTTARKTTRFDARGWEAGLDAADTAVLPAAALDE